MDESINQNGMFQRLIQINVYIHIQSANIVNRIIGDIFAVLCDSYPNTVESILCSTPSKPQLGDYCNGIHHFIIQSPI